MRRVGYIGITIGVLLALFILLRLASDRVGVAAQAPSAGVTEVAKQTTQGTIKETLESPDTAVCQSRHGLPDPTCTPGAVGTTNREDICEGGSTKRWRPAVSYTNRLKREGLRRYGFSDSSLSAYEEDHLIPLELGGDGYAPENLWPEPHGGTYGSKGKDRVENWLHRQVCSGAMTVEEAQQGIAANWEQYLSSAVEP
jgi:hypothetical protein